MPPIRHSKDKAANRPTLDDILNGPDEFGLLDVQYKQVSKNAPIELSNFESISVFIDEYKRLPSNDGDLSEKRLARRLKGFLDNTGLHPALKPYDRHGLLPEPAACAEPTVVNYGVSPPEDTAVNPEPAPTTVPEIENVTSLDDIFASAEFGSLEQIDDSIFDIQHVPVVSGADRDQPDEIAQRKVCEDFFEFEHIFRDVHAGLKSGVVKTARFQQASQVSAGDIFIMEGVLCLIDEVGEHRVDNQGRYDPRLRVIFENGTESNHLLQSLAKRLYVDENGRRIIRDADSVVDAFNNISHKDKRAGQIYFVATLGNNPTLADIPNLVKIGYTELTVEERTKNAERDIAFLESPVRILATIECYNLNPNKFESLIHGFLHAQRLTMTLTGKNGKLYKPREWFSVPLETAMEVVKRIIDGSIVRFRMDNTTGRLVEKSASKPS